jgi:hypothetical protein
LKAASSSKERRKRRRLRVQRDFKVSSKGMKGKHHNIPFVSLSTEEGEKLTLNLESPQMLKDFEIDQEFTVKIVEGAQKKLVE